jgi:hypothetical protein
MAEHGHRPELLLAAVRRTAEQQRLTAECLRDLAAAAHDAGITWQALGEAAGIPFPTLWRQVRAGSPVVVARAYHKPRKDADG